jgi:hypothetical protein
MGFLIDTATIFNEDLHSALSKTFGRETETRNRGVAINCYGLFSSSPYGGETASVQPTNAGLSIHGSECRGYCCVDSISSSLSDLG